MYTGHYFETQVERAKKKFAKDPLFPLDQTVSDFFVKCLDLPEAMARELYDFLGLDLDKLVCTVDFFSDPETFDYQKSSLDLQEWQEIVEVTNRFADEINLDRLEGFYQFFMREHLLQNG